MLFTSQIIDRMIDDINNTLKPEGCDAIRGFDTKDLPIPLKKIYLSLVPEKNTISYFESENKEFCQKNEVTIRMTCFSPLISLASDTHILLEEVLTFLNEKYITEISGYTIGETEYDDEVKAFRIVCRIFYERETCPAPDSQNESITVPQNFFCKTHVNDKNIHITAAEHAKYNEPFVTGTYTGHGYDIEKNINLGFRPSVLFIFRQGYPPVVFDSEILFLRNYCGFSFGGKNSKNVYVTSTGFYVLDKQSLENETRLNEDGIVYAYVAFK